MDVNLFYKSLFEDTLGLDVLGLESRIPDLITLIETKTLSTFSHYIPVKYRMYLDLTDKKNIVRKDHQTLGVEYYLEDPILDKFHLPILDILNVNYNNLSDVDPYDPESAAFYSSVIATRNNLSLESVLMGSEYAYNYTMIDFNMPWKRYHELRGSRILYLRNYFFSGQAEIEIKTNWPNVVSIPEEFQQIFMDLAKFDVKNRLWVELRYIQDIVTPSGNLDLKINDWESAEKDREDYLRELRTRTFPDRVMDKYFRII